MFSTDFVMVLNGRKICHVSILTASRLQKDIEDLVRICQKVMTLNIKKNPGTKEVNE